MIDLSSEAVLAINTLLTGGVAIIWSKWEARRKANIDRQDQRLSDHEQRMIAEIKRLDLALDEEREARKQEEALHAVTREKLNEIQGAIFAYQRCPESECPFRNGHGHGITETFRPLPPDTGIAQ